MDVSGSEVSMEHAAEIASAGTGKSTGTGDPAESLNKGLVADRSKQDQPRYASYRKRKKVQLGQAYHAQTHPSHRLEET